MTEAAFAFIVPFRNRSASRNWSSSVERCIETVRSLSGDGRSCAEVILIARDFPECDFPSNVTVIRREFEDPKDNTEMRVDKYRKIRVGLVELSRRARPYYVMKFDADDLVSDRLAEWILRHDNRLGYLVEMGYQLDVTEDCVTPVKRNFHRMCGSSNILFAESHALPGDLNSKGNFDLLRLGHNIVADEFHRRGTPLGCVPFPACIYRTGHGDNISKYFPKSPGVPRSKLASALKRAVKQALFRPTVVSGRPPVEMLRHEFLIPSRESDTEVL